VTAAATITYSLDRNSAAFFGASAFKFVSRQERVAGTFGRFGSIEGTMNDRLLVATWRDRTRCGWLTLAFSASLRSFHGSYGQFEERHAVRGRRRASAKAGPRSEESPASVGLGALNAISDLSGRRASLGRAIEPKRTRERKE
jgi:hypothetical protein